MTSEISPKIHDLLSAVTDLLRAKSAELSLSDAQIASIQPRGGIVPARLPVLSLLADMRDRAGAGTQAVVDGLIDAADDLAWRCVGGGVASNHGYRAAGR